jgi:hypothetical protein
MPGWLIGHTRLRPSILRLDEGTVEKTLVTIIQKFKYEIVYPGGPKEKTAGG